MDPVLLQVVDQIPFQLGQDAVILEVITGKPLDRFDELTPGGFENSNLLGIGDTLHLFHGPGVESVHIDLRQPGSRIALEARDGFQGHPPPGNDMRQQVCQPPVALLLQEGRLGLWGKGLEGRNVSCPIPGQQVEHTLTGDRFHKEAA